MNVQTRPGTVVGIDGVVFQCDSAGLVSALLIRPFEAARLRLRGFRVGNARPHVPLATCNGIAVRVVLADGIVRHYVVEHAADKRQPDFVDGLSWTSAIRFHERHSGGWDLTLPVEAFANIQRGDTEAAIERLNVCEGYALMSDTGTALVERVFGREMFVHPWVLDRFTSGDGYHLSAAAVPLLRHGVRVDARTRLLLRVDALPSTLEALERARRAEEDGDSARARSMERQAAGYLHTVSATSGAAIAWLLLRLDRRRLRRRRK
jgi:hypothetical protein